MSFQPPIRPPLTEDAARRLVQQIALAWSTRNATKVAMTLARDAAWQGVDGSVVGRDAIEKRLHSRWRVRLHERVAIRYWKHGVDSVSVRVESEWQHGRTGQWYRSSGRETWRLNDQGLIKHRKASMTDAVISADDRRIGI